MKLIIVLGLVAAVVAAPPPRNNDAEIVNYRNDVGINGYEFFFDQTDGTAREERGQIINEGREDEAIAVTGSFTWIGPDGVTYRIKFIADDKGYQPEIEQGPGGGVPPAVVASLLG